MTRMLQLSISSFAVAVVTVGFHAESMAQEPVPAFEVASVKPNKSGEISTSIGRLVGNDFTVVNAPLRDLIRYAYQLAEYELVGAPDWTSQERFDIQAKSRGGVLPAPGETPPERLMLRALLGERFKLAAHRETREMPIYALVVSRDDGRPGPQLRRTQTDCTAATSAPPAPGGDVRCGFRNTGTGLFIANSLSMTGFARFLTGQVRRMVVDRTGLPGEWDSQLKWAPDPLRADDGPTLFTALQEQLGLKLEPTRGPVEVLVVERVDRPTAD